MDLSAWRDFRCTLLPPWVFNLDGEAKQAIGRQGELLQDPDWYDKTMERGKELAAIPNHDLPPEIQHDIFNRLSEEARTVLVRHWPKAAQARPTEPLLPSMEHIAPESFELLVGLRQGYTIGLGTILRLQQIERRGRVAVAPASAGAILSQLRACLASLFSTPTRQAYAIRQSGLFDIPYPRAAPMAQADDDPVLLCSAFAKPSRPRGFPTTPIGAPIPMCSRTTLIPFTTISATAGQKEDNWHETRC